MRHPHALKLHFRTLTAMVLALVCVTCWLLSVRHQESVRLAPQRENSDSRTVTPGQKGDTAGSQMRSGATSTQPFVRNALGKLPLSFEANEGQIDPRVKFLARGNGYNIFLTSTEAVLALSHRQHTRPKQLRTGLTDVMRRTSPPRDFVKSDVATSSGEILRLSLAGAEPAARVEGAELIPKKSNYFLRGDSSKWRSDVPNYARVKYEGVYPGVDVAYYGNQGRLEYDFIVAPHADYKLIKLRCEGARNVHVDASSGDLVLTMKSGSELRQPKPIVYQVVEGERREVEGSYELDHRREVSFRIGAYDTSKMLIIDPMLVYSTYLGGDSDDQAYGIAVDAQGNAYVAGYAQSTNFPIVPDSLIAHPFQPDYGGGRSDAFVTKLNADGGVVYSTYLGGSGNADQNGGDDFANGIAIDAQGNAYIAGGTNSPDFPTKNPIQTTGDSFVTKLNAAGNALVYSTYLNGVGFGGENGNIAVDGAGHAYVVGGSGLFSNISSVLMKLNAAGTQILSSLQFDDFEAHAIALDPQGSAYIIGDTRGFRQDGSGIGFVVKKITFDSVTNATAIAYSQRFGGNHATAEIQGVASQASGIAVDAQGNAYIAGGTNAIDFPVQNALQPNFAGEADAILMKLNPSGGVIFSTYFGRSGIEGASTITVDAQRNIYIAGDTSSVDFPTLNAFQPGCKDCAEDGHDVFVTKFNPAGTGLIYSTFLGGSDQDFATAITLDAHGGTYVVGYTKSTDFPTKNAFQSGFGGSGDESYDAYVTKLIEPVTLQFSATSFTVGEGDGSVPITVTRSGDTANAVTVDFATSDATASSRSDYSAALGTLRFAAGETSKTFNVFITDDVFVEGAETFHVTLGNPIGAVLGNPATATVNITDNDSAGGSPTNPIDDPAFFVRQHYRDFLGREPDAAGLAFWVNQMTNCGDPNPEVCRINVSAAFFLSIEFQQTGYLVYRTYGAAFGTTRIGSTVPLTFNEFLPDVRRIGQNVVVGANGWEAQLEANKAAYFDEFVSRSAFTAVYPSTLTAAQFVDALNVNAGSALSMTERNALVAELSGGTKTRAQVLRAVAEDADFTSAQFNRAFVLMQYFGYLRRNPNDPPDSNFSGYNFWLAKLNSFNGNFIAAEMVKAFINSSEYRQRFGP